jgi:hypothetical protein
LPLGEAIVMPRLNYYRAALYLCAVMVLTDVVQFVGLEPEFWSTVTGEPEN